MDDFDKKCKLEKNDELGRYVVAAVNIKAGETIFFERPILIIPIAGEKRCANCLKLTKGFCSTCQIFPLCENCTQHNEYDCKMFADMKDLRLVDLQKNNEVYGPLKCLLLKENPETTKYYDQLIELEAHLQERRNTDVWKLNSEKVVKPILESGLKEHLTNAEAINEELLQQFGGIVDVNCFEIRAPDESAMRGIYVKGALLAHNCVANTAIAIDEQYQMKVYANRDIAEGEMVYNCYTNVLLGTDERRQSLKMGKYFHCTCARCEDPSELGSHMSSFICAPCAGSNRDGFVVKKQNKWQCLTCEHTLKTDYVENILDRAKEEIFHAKDDIYHYELLMAKLSRILHRNHYLMVDLKQNITVILRSIIMNLAHRPGRKVYERKVRLCQEILTVLHIVQPGISRMRGIALYELSNAWGELSRLRFSENEVTEGELVTLLQKCEAMLREAIRMLIYEPVETPEGKLTKSMLKELKDLQNDMKLLEQKREEVNEN